MMTKTPIEFGSFESIPDDVGESLTAEELRGLKVETGDHPVATPVGSPDLGADEPTAGKLEKIPTYDRESTNKKIQKVRKFNQKVALDIIERIQRGDTFVECVGHLIQTYKLPIQAAQEVMHAAIDQTVGQLNHDAWTAQYRMLAQDLYKRNLAAGKIQAANSVLNNMIKLQFLSQSLDTKNRAQEHEEKKFQAIISMPKNDAENSPQAAQGFRVSIESYSGSPKQSGASVPLLVDSSASVKDE